MAIPSNGWVKVHNAITATATAVISGATAGLQGPESYRRHEVAVSVGAGAGQWTVTLQHSPDGGTTWIDCDRGAAETTLSGGETDTIHYDGAPKEDLRVAATEDVDGSTCTCWVAQYDDGVYL